MGDPRLESLLELDVVLLDADEEVDLDIDEELALGVLLFWSSLVLELLLRESARTAYEFAVVLSTRGGRNRVEEKFGTSHMDDGQIHIQSEPARKL